MHHRLIRLMASSLTRARQSVCGGKVDFGCSGDVSTKAIPLEACEPMQGPHLLLMGQRRSGKSSIRQVLFNKLPSSNTLFLEATTRIERCRISSIINIDLWDLPGQLTHLDGIFDVMALNDTKAIIWVIDAQDDLYTPLSMFQEAVMRISKLNPGIYFEVFIHKIDGISGDHCLETRVEIIERTERVLGENSIKDIQIFYHLTSIYDHSIFEAMGRVVQRLNPNLETLENMLNLLCLTCGMQKAFLIDAATKIYIATDSSPVDMQGVEIYCDYIDFISGFTDIYGYERQKSTETGSEVTPTREAPEISSKITISDSMVLHLTEMNEHLVLACIMSKSGPEQQGLVDFNIGVFQDGLLCLLDPAKEET